MRDRIRIFDCQAVVHSKYVIRLFVDVSKKSLKVLTKNGFNDSQFNMWNEFEESFPQLFLCCVIELFPILIVFNRFIPSILNVCTDLK